MHYVIALGTLLCKELCILHYELIEFFCNFAVADYNLNPR